MEYVRPFQDITKKDVRLAGGKGASLGEMTKAGIPVPPGFVVLSAAFERFLEETDLDVEVDAELHRVKHTDMASVEAGSEKLQALILDAKMPKDIASAVVKQHAGMKTAFVAVRSSATAEDSTSAAWAGQLDTFLNTPKAKVLTNVQRCWASLFTPRAIFYRFEQKLHRAKISVAVVVQQMVESEVSGTAFSVHPVTQDRGQLIIEAGFGLGEAIVSGQITPDSYVVEKRGWRILDVNVSEQERAIRRAGNGNAWKPVPAGLRAKQKLTNARILELAKLVVQIEKHYRFPVDIEWALAKGKFFITQSRPITTLK